MSSGEIWLVRHGETSWSLDGRHTGCTDVPLTAEGERQGEAVGRRLAGRVFARVLTSPLTRAVETARRAGYGAVAEVDADLHEWDYGEYEGRTTADIRREAPGWSVWTRDPPGGETAERVGERAGRVIERCAVAGGDVALFAHGHFLRVLAATWLGLPPRAGCYLALGTATISILGHEHETRVVSEWNESCDLLAVPLP